MFCLNGENTNAQTTRKKELMGMHVLFHIISIVITDTADMGLIRWYDNW